MSIVKVIDDISDDISALVMLNAVELYIPNTENNFRCWYIDIYVIVPYIYIYNHCVTNHVISTHVTEYCQVFAPVSDHSEQYLVFSFRDRGLWFTNWIVQTVI